MILLGLLDHATEALLTVVGANASCELYAVDGLEWHSWWRRILTDLPVEVQLDLQRKGKAIHFGRVVRGGSLFIAFVQCILDCIAQLVLRPMQIHLNFDIRSTDVLSTRRHVSVPEWISVLGKFHSECCRRLE